MGIILMLAFIAYIVLSIIAVGLSYKFFKSKKTVIIVAIFFALLPFRRYIFYNTLFFFYKQNSLQEIYKAVESPVSVYWEDKVWPGFDVEWRKRMVSYYLDGKHLKMLAMNDDEKIFLYQAIPKDFEKSEALRPDLEKIEREIDIQEKKAINIAQDGGDNTTLWRIIRNNYEPIKRDLKKRYEENRDEEVKKIMSRVKIFANAGDLPSMKYQVTFKTLPDSINGWLHADSVSIVERESGKEIAFSKRYMAYAGFISKISGEQPRFDYKLGDTQVYAFDDKVLFSYANVRGGWDITRSRDLNFRLNPRY